MALRANQHIQVADKGNQIPNRDLPFLNHQGADQER